MVEKEPQFNYEEEPEPENKEGTDEERSALDVIQTKSKEILKELSDYHGLEHTVLVANHAKVLAIGEGKDVFNAEVAGWTHDWGRALEKTDQRKRSHAALSREISKDVYRALWEQGKITASQYGEIQRAIGRHSLISETPRETLKIVRDADRLSRFGSLGLYHNVFGLLEEGKPFYIEGHPIIRSDDAPMIKLKNMKSAIDSINLCLDFEKLLETESAREIFNELKDTNKAFLRLFADHKDLNDGKLWLAFLQKPATEFKTKRNKFANNFLWTGNTDDFRQWLRFYKEVESPEIFSEENFQDFLKQYKIVK